MYSSNRFTKECHLEPDVSCWDCNKKRHIERIWKKRSQDIRQTSETSDPVDSNNDDCEKIVIFTIEEKEVDEEKMKKGSRMTVEDDTEEKEDIMREESVMLEEGDVPWRI